MNTFDASRELPVWVGGLIGLFVLITIVSWFKPNSSADAATRATEAKAIKPENLLFLQTFAATFIASALLQDFITVFVPSSPIPLSAKYVMALVASLPGYILKRRG